MFVQSERIVQKYTANYATDITNLYLYSLVALSKETNSNTTKKLGCGHIIFGGWYIRKHTKIVTPPNKGEPPEKKIYII